MCVMMCVGILDDVCLYVCDDVCRYIGKMGVFMCVVTCLYVCDDVYAYCENVCDDMCMYVCDDATGVPLQSGQLNEYTERKEMAAEIVCMSLGSVPQREQRSRFLAVGLADQTVRVISLDPSVSCIRG